MQHTYLHTKYAPACHLLMNKLILSWPRCGSFLPDPAYPNPYPNSPSANRQQALFMWRMPVARFKPSKWSLETVLHFVHFVI